MKKLLTTCLLLGALFTQSSAQDEALVTWPFLTSTQLEASLGGQLEGPQFSVTGLSVKDYGGPDACIRITNTEKWETAENPGLYIEFSVTPKEGAIFNATEISFWVCGSGGGNMRANFYYSTDPTFATKNQIDYRVGADLTRDSNEGLDQVKVTINEEINKGERIYLRIYPYYKQESTGKHICLKDMTIKGTTTATEVPGTVVWPFISDIKPVINGALVAQEMTYGSNTRHYGWDARVTINATAVDNGTFCTNTQNCAWEASTAPVDDVYVQYAVSPKAGATYTIKDISLMIAATTTNSMAAAVYGSKDENFATKKELKPITDLVNNELELWEITLQEPEIVATGETYYVRVYPFSKSASTYKLVGIRNVTINGSLLGATADPAEVSLTNSATYISTTSAILGGNISNDGGAPVTERGIAYGINQNPTIENSKETSGEGTGMFTTTLSGLTAGTTYYARAYAINKAGVSYGPEVSFTTLSELTAPTVITTGSTSVRNVSMIIKGNVTEWGGTAVTERGVTWATSNNPTIETNKLTAGEDIGSYQVFIDGLTPETKYYVRAYAINSSGTAYGEELEVTTKATDPDVTKVIAQDGAGDYTTVQEAFDAVPSDYTGRWIIRIKPGTYNERPILTKGKVNVYLVGENAENTIITHNTSAGTPNPDGGTWGTSKCQTMAIEADDFTAINITIENTFVNSRENAAKHKDTQAVALRTQGDRQAFYNCRITGYQDTYLGNSIGRAYFKNCYIEGNVDFIFGRQTVVFDQCTTYVNRDGSVITAPSTDKTTAFGMVFLDCKLTAPTREYQDFNGDLFRGFYYGRPWQQRPRSAFIRCETPETLYEKGWTTMSGGLSPVFVEYGCTGEGATPERLAKRGNEGVVLTEEEASIYTVENIFRKETDPSFAADWMPKEKPDDDLVTGINIPHADNNKFSSYNIPNPFNDYTTINYVLPVSSDVTISIMDIKGNLIYKLHEIQNDGSHSVTVNTSNLAAGIYFYTIQTKTGVETRKMIKY